jgi:hypothetical protein
LYDQSVSKADWVVKLVEGIITREAVAAVAARSRVREWVRYGMAVVGRMVWM